MRESDPIASLGFPFRVWAVGPIHGDCARLKLLHQYLGANLKPNDSLIYLGNYFGWGEDICETVDELLNFRCSFLAEPEFRIENLVYLRGAQEEMWQKLLQLQFSTDPESVLQWIATHGGEATIRAYGGRLNDGLKATRDGVLALTRWVGSLRQSMRSYDGHGHLLNTLKDAATSGEGQNSLLFVHAGLDPSRSLVNQGDHFWWGTPAFEHMNSAYAGFKLVIRGINPRRQGLQIQPFSVSLDGGYGQEGSLICALFAPDGEVLKTIEV